MTTQIVKSESATDYLTRTLAGKSFLEKAKTFFLFGMCLAFSGQLFAANDTYNFDSLGNNGKANADTIFGSLSHYSTTFFIALKTLGVAVGALCIFLGFQRFKKASQEPNSQVTHASGIALILIGGAFAALPWFVGMSANTVTTS